MSKKVSALMLCMLLAILILMANLLYPKTVQCASLQGYNLLPSFDEQNMTAKSGIVIEQNSKRVLMQKNMNEQLAMASTTKIMTALVAIENTADLDEIFLIDNRAVGIEGTSIYLKKDEHLSMRHLLYGLMLASGNDASLAIGYKVGNGDIDKFVDMMNSKVEELGLHNTHFDNTHGLDSKTHYTSAYDLAVLTAEAMKNKDFREIVSTKFIQIPSNTPNQNRFLRNKHKLLHQNMLGCEGVKTGFTDNARRCCVTSCQRDGMRLIAVVLNCQDMFEESRKMLESCFQEYKYVNVLEANKYIDSIFVENGAVDSVKTYTKQAFYYPLKENEIEKINCKSILQEKLIAPVESEKEVGEYKIYFDNDLIFSTKIYTMESVETKDYGQKLKDIVENWY